MKYDHTFPGGYVPGSTKSTEAFRAMAMAWSSMKNCPPEPEPEPMKMPIPETYPMIKQKNAGKSKGFTPNYQKNPSPQNYIAKRNKNSYSNSNSNSNTNSNTNSNSYPNSQYKTNNTYNTHAPNKNHANIYPQPHFGRFEDHEDFDSLFGHEAQGFPEEPVSESVCGCVKREKIIEFGFVSREHTLEDVVGELKARLGIRDSNLIWVELGGYYRKLGGDLCLYAIETAQRAQKHHWPYVRGILKRLDARGIRNRRDAEVYTALTPTERQGMESALREEF